MAKNVLDRYGIKEVADVTFYTINDAGEPETPVLFLDTLKVSTIEQTAETAEARGGKGNPMLVSWDFGKDINLSIEDALFSPKSMSIMLGNGSVDDYAKTTIVKTARARVGAGSVATFMGDVIEGTGDKKDAVRKEITATFEDNGTISSFKSGNETISYYTPVGVYDPQTGDELSANPSEGDIVYIKYDQDITGKKIEISADSFPGTLTYRAPWRGLKIA